MVSAFGAAGQAELAADLGQRLLARLQMVRSFIREHNQQVKQAGKGVRVLPCCLPTKSPWSSPIEPTWVHGKRHVVQRDGLLSAQPLAQRVCAYYGCAYEDHLSLPEQVS